MHRYRSYLLPVALLLSPYAKTAIAEEATPGAPSSSAPIPPPPPLPPPPPPLQPALPSPPVAYPTAPVPAPSTREVVYVEEPRAHRHIEEPGLLHEGFSFGFELNSFQQDFGFGGRITTPNFAHFIRISAGGGVAWFPNALQTGPSQVDTWDAYYYGRLALELTGPQFGVVRTYAFAGAILLAVPKDLSSTEFDVGGIGGFGFEFGISKYSSYYIELGAIGTGAVADQLVDMPTFANGFLISVGSRFYP